MISKIAHKTWYEAGAQDGWIGIYEQEMIQFLEEEFGEQAEDVKLCLVFTSLFVKAGHVCLPLDKAPREWISLLDMEIEQPDILSKQIINTDDLNRSELVAPDGHTPFTLADNKLFISRHWWYEKTVAQKLTEISSTDNESVLNKNSKAVLESLFPADEEQNVNWQKAAVAMALFKQFLLISGGPGTGKTTTVGKILALLLKTSGGSMRIALAAPTGKAAARMGEALQDGLSNLPLSEEELRQIPAEAKTLHRLLWGFDHTGLLPPVEKKFLPYDLIIIDEASMIDLTLMYRLLSHIKPGTRLIMLGDKDQLSSVEAGAVLSDICKKEKNGFNSETAEYLKESGLNKVPVTNQAALDDSIIYLEKSWRFDESSGIGKLADEVKKSENKPEEQKGGQKAEVRQKDLFQAEKSGQSIFESLLTSNEYPDLDYIPFRYGLDDLQLIFKNITERVNKCKGVTNPETIFKIWQNETWLSVLRHGPLGSKKLNWLIENDLIRRNITKPVQEWYHGRPVMVTRNDYSLGIFNGDVGICLIDGNNVVWIYFPDRQTFRRIRANRLSSIEPAYVITVHKSQGSEFNRVNLLLPKKETPILTKELIYTAITRAREGFILYGSVEMFGKGAGRKTQRFTGLRDKLE